LKLIKKNILFTRETNFWTRHKVKIISTLVALFVWFLIVSGGTFDYQVSIPITCTNSEDSYIVVNKLPQNGHVILRGQGIHLLIFSLFKEGRLNIDPQWEPGQTFFFPSEKNITLFGNAQKLQIVKFIEPDSIEIHVEKLIIREVPVINQVNIVPTIGHTIVGDIIVEPDMALIKGPKSVIDTVTSIYTKKAQVENVKYPVQKQIDLIKPDILHLDLLNKNALVSADIQKLMEKKIINIPVNIINLPPNVSALIIPSHISLVIQGGANLVFPVTENDIEAYIDYARQRPSSQQDFPAYIKPITGIRYRDIEPKRFKVILERE